MPNCAKPFDYKTLFANFLDLTQFGVYHTQNGVVLMKSAHLSDALFSNVQRRVLGLIFGHSERSFYISEIVREVRSGRGAVERELSRLEQSGLISAEKIGNQKHFRANKLSPIFEELRSIVLKTSGFAEPLRQALETYAAKIKAAFVYGSLAKGTDTARSDIDLMVIGDDLTYSDLYEELTKAERFLGRPVNPTLLSPEEWKRKLSRKDSVIAKIKAQPKIFVIGSKVDL
jgi:predicted nucleotidyltransferase/predicted transcriptional regulator